MPRTPAKTTFFTSVELHGHLVKLKRAIAKLSEVQQYAEKEIDGPNPGLWIFNAPTMEVGLKYVLEFAKEAIESMEAHEDADPYTDKTTRANRNKSRSE